jgi:hypothetical protein
MDEHSRVYADLPHHPDELLAVDIQPAHRDLRRVQRSGVADVRTRRVGVQLRVDHLQGQSSTNTPPSSTATG